MKRGDILLVHGTQGAATKARPCLVVQRTATLGVGKLTVCPITSMVDATNIIRPIITPTATNGLRRTSQVEVDWILTEHLRYFGPVIGELEHPVMAQVDLALRRWLDL